MESDVRNGRARDDLLHACTHAQPARALKKRQGMLYHLHWKDMFRGCWKLEDRGNLRVLEIWEL